MPVNWDALREDTPDSETPAPNLGVSGPLPRQLKPDTQVALKTPATDKLMDDPAFMAVVKEHAAKLQAVEHQAQGGDPNDFMGHAGMAFRNDRDAIEDILTDMKGSFLSARNSNELLDLRSKQVLGLASDTDSARADYLSARRRPWVSPRSIDGFLKEVPGKVAGMLGSMAGDDSVGGSILAGAGAGALAGSVMPGLGTAGGVVAGASSGFLSGTALNMAKSSMGEFYDGALRMRTADGRPMDSGVARGAALVLGAVNGALGVLPLAGALSNSGLGRVLMGPGAARWLAGAMGAPGATKVFGAIATNFANGMGAQAIIGGLQELNTIMAEHAVMLGTDPGADFPERDELGRVLAAGKGGAQLGMGVGALETAAHSSGGSVAMYENIGEVTNRVFQEDRAKAKVWGDAIADTHGIKDVTLPRAKVAKLFQEIGLEGDDLLSAMPEVHRQMGATEGDPKAEISFSMGDLAGYVAPTKQWAQLKGDMRDGAGRLTLNEIRKLSKSVETDTEALKPKLSPDLKAVYDDVYAQLSKTKSMGASAEKAATIYASTVNAISEATGESPKVIHDRMGLKFIERPEAAIDERAAGVPGATVQDSGKYRVMDFTKPVPDDMKTYLAELREHGDKFGDTVKPDGTFGELFARLVKSTGSPTDAARVLGGMGWDGIDTGKTKLVWRPDAVLPKADPLKITRGMTEFEPGKTTISFSQHANVATVVHELGHVFLRMWHQADLTPTETVTSKSREATLAAVERLSTKFKQEHDARAEVFANEQKARADKYAEGKKQAASIERKLDSEKFQAATGSEGADDTDTSVADTSEMEARVKREAKAAKQAESDAQARDISALGEGDNLLAKDKNISEGADTRVRENDNGSPYNFRRQERKFQSEQSRLEEEFLDSQDSLEEKHDARMAALKSGVKTKKTVTQNPMSDSVNKLLQWLGADSSGALDAKGEEKFARAFVDYLKSGEAPSAALRPVFGSYKSWLTMLYGTESSLGAPMSPEIRQVFDKLVASQKAIDYAKKNLGAPLFDKKPEAMTDAQFEKYRRDMADLAATAQSQIEKEIFSHMSKEGIDAFEKQKAGIRDELLANDQTHNMVSWLKTGERLTDGPTPDNDSSHKLDTAALKRMGVGGDTLRQLADYHEQGGLDPAMVARVFGRDDPHEMVAALKSYVPLEQAVNTEAASRMPGWVDPLSWLKNRAVDKFSGEVVPKMLWAEFKAMGGKLGDGGAGNYDILRTLVKNQLRYQKISTLDPEHYLQEFHRLGDEVQKAQRDQIAAGMDFKAADLNLRKTGDKNAETAEDKPLAQLLADKHGGSPEEWQARLDKKTDGEEALSPTELQRRRIVAFESWKLARQAREDASKLNSLLDKMRNDFDLRKTIADNYGPEHVAALDGAAEAYGFFQPETPAANPIGAYVNEQVKKGADIVEDPELARRAESRTPVGQLNINQLQHANDFLQSLYHYITQDVGKFDAGTGAKPLAPMVARMAKSIRDNFPKANAKDPSRLRGMVAALTTPEHIIRLLEDDIHGDISRATVQLVEDGKAHEDTMHVQHDSDLRDAVKGINDGSLVGDSTLRVRDLESTDPVTGRKVASRGRLLSKTDLMAAVLNYGSARNREALLKGYGISHEELMAAVAHDLSANHIEFANKFWAEHDKYFPESAETYAKRTGLTLEQVKAIPFAVKFADGTTATATGGYVPIRMSAKARNLRDAQSVRGYSPVEGFEVRDDMTLERQGSYGPVELDLGRVLSSVHAKIHYAAMADPVAQVSKIILHPEFRKAVSDTIGPEYNDQLFKWLRNAARDGNPLAPLGDWDKAYRWILSGASQASVGFNHLTAVKQLPFAISQATTKVGLKNMSGAIADVMTDWKGSWARAIDESPVLRRMNDNPNVFGQLTPFDPEVSVPLATKLGQIGHGTVFKSLSDVRAYLSELGMAHQTDVRQIGALFAYEAAKKQAVAEGRPDVVQYAEAVVRQTVGGGDASSFMTEPGMARGTVMLYSHMSLIASEILSSTTKTALTHANLLNLAASLTGFLAIPALAAAVVSDDFKDMPNAATHTGDFISKLIRWQILGHGLGRATPIFGDSVEQVFAYDKPTNRVAGGPIGQLTGAVRSTAQALTSPKKHLSDVLPALATAASIMTHTPTAHIYKDSDLVEGILSGRYGQNGHKWYDIMAHGGQKEGFK